MSSCGLLIAGKKKKSKEFLAQGDKVAEQQKWISLVLSAAKVHLPIMVHSLSV
jgi:hypothetical protein